MASAQVLKKQEQLEAGRKKLEEYRRKKSSERVKKATPIGFLNSSGTNSGLKPSESELGHAEDSGLVATSDASAVGYLETSDVKKNETKGSNNIFETDFSSAISEVANQFVLNKGDVYPIDRDLSHRNEIYTDDTASSSLSQPMLSDLKLFEGEENDDSLSAVAHLASSVQGVDTTSIHHNYHGSYVHPVRDSDVFVKDISLDPKSFDSNLQEDNLGLKDYQGNAPKSLYYPESVHSVSNMAEGSFLIGQRLSGSTEVMKDVNSDSVADRDRVNPLSSWTSDIWNKNTKSDTQNSVTFLSPSLPAAGRSSRPSFLDGMNISKGPSSSHISLTRETKTDVPSSKVNQIFANSSTASSYGVDHPNHIMENKHDFFPQTSNEDFTALEQYIEDLTQEKFALQRGLEASRVLAESLASENSALTESFNQQGSIVNQLKFELSKLQEEIKVQLVELEAVKVEYINTQLECKAADERARLLASEVIGLEEKVLRSRSNELKLERQLENNQSEFLMYRKKMSSLEKERQDLQSTIDALQEEKKLFESKLLKAHSSKNSVDANTYSKKDEWTLTEDLDFSTAKEALTSKHSTSGDSYSSELLQESSLLDLESLPLSFPSDQMRIVHNINTLIAELAMERDQLARALSVEASQRSTLLELNKDLTRKLEAQTQRLELLTSQIMINDNTLLPRQPDLRVVNETAAYADEGDEVVEKVLGWIMKLFPGGPSSRRNKRFSV